MKKITFILALLLVFGLAFGAAEELKVSGSVSWSFGDDDIAEAPGPYFDSGKSGAVGKLKAATGDGMVEAGVTINLLPSISITEGDDPIDVTDLDNEAYYNEMLDAVDWWTGNSGDVLGSTLTTSNLITNNVTTAEMRGYVTAGTDDDDITWTQARIDASRASFVAVVNAITAQINNYTNLPAGYDVTTGRGVLYEDSLTATQITAIEDAQDLYDDFEEGVLGEDTDDSWSASFPVTNAYLRVKGIAKVIDLTFEVGGKAVGIGSMVTSDDTSGDANVGLTLGLSSGVVKGLSASATVTTSEGEAETSNDDLTYEYETEAAEEPEWGMMVNAGYMVNDMAGGSVTFGIPDLGDVVPLLSIAPSVKLAGVIGSDAVSDLSLMGEFNMILGSTMAMGAGAKLSANIMGIAPTVAFYWKDANYYGDDTHNLDGSDDIDDESGAKAEFDSIDDASATAMTVDLKVDLAKIMGMKLVTITGGMDLMLAGSSSFGWDAGLGLDFSEVLKQPLTVGFNIGQYGGADMTWAAKLGYTFFENLKASFTFEQTEEDVIGYSLAGKVSF